MFKNLRIRTKLAFALVIPLLALVASSSLVISAANQRAEDARAVAEGATDQVALATAALGPSGILTALSNERTAEALAVIGLDPKMMGGTLDQAQTRQATDQAVQQFKATIAAKPAAVQETYKRSIDNLAKLSQIRAISDTSTLRTLENPDATLIYDDYSALVHDLFDANTRAATAVDNTDLRAGVRFIDELTRHQDATSVIQRAIGEAVTFHGAQTLAQDPKALADTAGLNRLAGQLRSDMERSSDPFYAGLANSLFALPAIVSTSEFRDKAVAGQPVDIQSLLGPQTQEATAAYATYLHRAAERLQADADAFRSDAQAAADEAARQAQGVIIVTSAVLALAVLVTFMASRSITGPLARLVGAAENMAQKALPHAVQEILETPPGEDVQVPELATIDDRGGYEIAEVASALNTVQDSATELAVEQAVLRRNIADAFVNLGRRNQALLTRLLDAITQMEREEADPDELEALFTLDHLATRMRRNAESLVVLAGVDTRRQWSNPVAVVDVVRGALGEVEQYQRVDIVELDEVLISGSTVADLTHLVAELLENALQYSPPSRTVEIRGRAHPRGYELSIIDHGVGMPADDLAVANTRLAGGESFTVAPSRYLGHYVVGRQATRLGLDVGLVDTPGGGTTATIEIGRVITDEPPVEAAPEAETRHELQPEPEPEPIHASLDGRFAHRALTPKAAPVTAAAAVAASEPEPAPTPVGTTTNSGYTRRVRGANVPTTTVRTARSPGEARRSGGGAETMRSALSSMQAGMRRSQDEADHSTNESGES